MSEQIRPHFLQEAEKISKIRQERQEQAQVKEQAALNFGQKVEAEGIPTAQIYYEQITETILANIRAAGKSSPIFFISNDEHLNGWKDTLQLAHSNSDVSVVCLCKTRIHIKSCSLFRYREVQKEADSLSLKRICECDFGTEISFDFVLNPETYVWSWALHQRIGVRPLTRRLDNAPELFDNAGVVDLMLALLLDVSRRP